MIRVTQKVCLSFYTLEGIIDRIKVEKELVSQETWAESKEMMLNKEK